MQKLKIKPRASLLLPILQNETSRIDPPCSYRHLGKKRPLPLRRGFLFRGRGSRSSQEWGAKLRRIAHTGTVDACCSRRPPPRDPKTSSSRMQVSGWISDSDLRILPHWRKVCSFGLRLSEQT